MPELSKLRLEDASDDDLCSLQFSETEHVELSFSENISARGLRCISNWPIKTLDVSGCYGLDAEALAEIAKLPMLDTLNLDCCSHLSDDAFARLIDAPRLRVLTVRWCYDLADVACEAFGAMPLEELQLEGCEYITDACVAALARSHTLRILDLPPFSSISDRGIESLVLSEIPLETLGISRLSDVTDATLTHLARMKSLRTLLIMEIPTFSADGIAELRRRLPQTEVRIIKPQPANPTS